MNMKTLAALAILASASASANIIRNGSFEDPISGTTQTGAILYGSVTSFRGGTTFDGWVVGRDSVDIVPASFWTPPDGSQSLELNGLGPGYIYQDLNTTPGEMYTLTFAMAANGNLQTAFVGRLRVSFGGVQSEDFEKQSEATIAFATRSTSFVATESVTRLMFESLNENINFGAIIDDIQLDGPGSAIWPPVGNLPTYSPFLPGYVGPITVTPDAGSALGLLGCALLGIWSAKRILA
jgi:choice-of-anchor C domain-containing protein